MGVGIVEMGMGMERGRESNGGRERSEGRESLSPCAERRVATCSRRARGVTGQGVEIIPIGAARERHGSFDCATLRVTPLRMTF